MDQTDQTLLAPYVLPVSKMLHTLYVRECDSFGYDAPNALILADIGLASGIRVEASGTPTIRVSVAWCMNHVSRSTTGPMTVVLRKAIKLAHTRLRWTLSHSVPRCSAVLGSDGKFSLVASDGFTMPERHFHVSYVVTVTCPVTGVSETAYGVSPNALADAERGLRMRATQLAFASERASDLLPILPKTTEPDSATITDTELAECYTELSYND